MGEITSVRVFSSTIESLGVKSEYMDPYMDNWPIITDSNYLNADINFELTNEKYFENTTTLSMIREVAHTINFSELDNLFEKYPIIETQIQDAKAWIYVAHFNNQGKINIPQNEFEITLNEILKVDKDNKCGDIRCKDALLMDMFYVTLSRNQALELKKHLVSPRIKSEFNSYIKQQTDENKYIS